MLGMGLYKKSVRNALRTPALDVMVMSPNVHGMNVKVPSTIRMETIVSMAPKMEYVPCVLWGYSLVSTMAFPASQDTNSSAVIRARN